MCSLIMCRGLPASGKSTWAKAEVSQNPNKVCRISRDDFRDMFSNYTHSDKNEKLVTAARDFSIAEALRRGYDVIVDETGLDPRVEERMRTLARNAGVEFKIKDFTDIPIGVCKERNAKRARPVPEDVIDRMYNKHIKPLLDTPFTEQEKKERNWLRASFDTAKHDIDVIHSLRKNEDSVHDLRDYKLLKPDMSLPLVVICDLDGTLAWNTEGRSYFDWKRVGEDTLNPYVFHALRAYSMMGVNIFFFSGRDASCMHETTQWLESNGFSTSTLYDHDGNPEKIKYVGLFMRASGSNEDDVIVKERMYKQNIEGKYSVLAVIDDRPKVCDGWRALGLPVFQVGNPNVRF